MLVGCGVATEAPAQQLSNCLNGKGFLVQPATGRVAGTAPDGVAFSVTTGGVIDDRGNPGNRRLSVADRSTIRNCLP